MKAKRSIILLLAVVFLVSSYATSFALVESDELPWERFSVKLGGTGTTLDSSARVGTAGVGLEIDFEEALGLESSSFVFRLDALYRSSKNLKHTFGFSYFDLRRDSTKVLTEEIEFGGETFTVGQQVDSFYNLRIFRGDYRYSFLLDERVDLTVGLGLYVMPLEVGIEASTVNREEMTPVLPVLSLGFNFVITPKVFLKQQYGVFYLEYDNFEGGMTSANIAVEYNAFENIGFGLAFDSLRVRLKAEDEDYPSVDFVGEVNFSYAALMLYMKIFF